MWASRDLSLVIILSVVNFLFSLLVGQLGNLLTGITVLNLIFVFGHNFFISLGLLIYEGRRWRFFLQVFLFALLTTPTYQSGAPFDFISKIPMILNSFFIDLIFNSVYLFYQERNKLFVWVMMSSVTFFFTYQIFRILYMVLFFSPEVLKMYVNGFLMLLPITLPETIIGTYFGNQVYHRIRKERDSFERKK